MELTHDQKAILAQHELNEMGEVTKEKFEKVALKYFGPPPAYNGVLGDSHDCASCNYRRSFPDGIDNMKDCEDGITLCQARAALTEGYAKTGRTPPVETAQGPFHAQAVEMGDILKDIAVLTTILELLGEKPGQTR